MIDKTFTITPAEGYLIDDIIVDDTSFGAVDSYTFNNIKENHSIMAKFKKLVTLFSGANDYEVHKINPSDMTQSNTYTGHSIGVVTLAYGGGYLYSGASSELHKIDPSDMSFVDEYTEITDLPRDLVYGNDNYLYLSGYDQRIDKIDPSDMTQNNTYVKYDDTETALYWYSLVYGDNDYLYAGSYGELHKIDPSDLSQVAIYNEHSAEIWCLVYGDDGYLYSGSQDQEVHKINPDTMTQELSAYNSGYMTGIYAIAYGDGYLYSQQKNYGAGEYEIHKIDPSNMTQVAVYSGEHTDEIKALIYGDDGYLYSGAEDNEIHKINPSTMTLVNKYTEHTGGVFALLYV